MALFKKRWTILLSALLCALVLWGCESKSTPKVEMPSGMKLPADTQELTAVLTAEELPVLDSFTDLRRVDLSGSDCYEEMLAWGLAHPQTELVYTVALPGGIVAGQNETALDLSALDASQAAQALPLLAYLPALESLKLGTLPPEQAAAFAEAYPALSLDFRFTMLGQTLDTRTQSLDLSAAGHTDAAEIQKCLPLLPALTAVELGNDQTEGGLTWDDIYAIHQLCPQAVLSYDFTLYGRHFTLADTSMDFRHVPMDDEGALVLKAASCMPNLTYLDMDSCGVSDESMAAIRDALPQANVVWRIWFGDRYSVRTDVEKILASNPGLGGELTYENTRSLQYCTKVKYMDLGHNSYLSSLDFCAFMPDLEALVVAMGSWSDCSPLANCPKLEYLELQTSALNDLRPLTVLKNLRHLDIGYCFALHDISPLYELPDLERLWIGGYTPIPEEQVEKMRSIAPNCEINTTTINPTDEGWRYLGADEFGIMQLAPRYALLRDQFGYSGDLNAASYSYYWNDPLYYG